MIIDMEEHTGPIHLADQTKIYLRPGGDVIRTTGCEKLITRTVIIVSSAGRIIIRAHLNGIQIFSEENSKRAIFRKSRITVIQIACGKLRIETATTDRMITRSTEM